MESRWPNGQAWPQQGPSRRFESGPALHILLFSQKSAKRSQRLGGRTSVARRKTARATPGTETIPPRHSVFTRCRQMKKMLYLVGFDLRHSRDNFTRLRTALQRLAAVRVSDSIWLVNLPNTTATEIYSQLIFSLDTGESVFVISVAQPADCAYKQISPEAVSLLFGSTEPS